MDDLSKTLIANFEARIAALELQINELRKKHNSLHVADPQRPFIDFDAVSKAHRVLELKEAICVTKRLAAALA